MSDPTMLREDLTKEYYAVLEVVLNFHGRLITVKGWSVTLSLAALGLGFQQRHYVLFLLGAVTGAAFWWLDARMTRFQYRYFTRLREIEYTAYLINRVPLDYTDGPREISAPRINLTWRFKGYPVNKDTGKPLPRRRPWWQAPRRGTELASWYDWRADEPYRQKPQDIYRDLRHCWWWPSVALPHVVAVVLGVGLFILAVVKAPGFTKLHL